MLSNFEKLLIINANMYGVKIEAVQSQEGKLMAIYSKKLNTKIKHLSIYMIVGS